MVKQKLTPLEFIVSFFETHAKPGVFFILIPNSGLNAALREQFPRMDSRKITKELEEKEDIIILPGRSRGTVLLYIRQKLPVGMWERLLNIKAGLPEKTEILLRKWGSASKGVA